MEKHFRERTGVVKFPVFSDFFVGVVFSSDFEKTRKRFDKTLGIMENPVDALTIDLPSGVCLLFRDDCDPGTIAHECWHAIHRLMEWVEIAIENECVAYHLDYLVNQCHRIKNKKETQKNARGQISVRTKERTISSGAQRNRRPRET